MELINPLTGVRQYYGIHGPEGGPAIILLHGWTANHRRWERVRDLLARSYRVIEYDHRGHGLSDKRQTLDFGLGSYVLDLLGFMNALGLERAVLAGHSMGGMIALQFARAFPERVDRLVLAGSAARVASDDRERRSLMRAAKIFLSFFSFARWVKDRAKRKQPDVFTDILDPRFDPTPASAGLSLMAVAHWDFRDQLPLVAMPALAIAARDDDTVHWELSQEMARLMPDCRLVTLQDCTHHFILEKPREVFDAMDAFLRETAH